MASKLRRGEVIVSYKLRARSQRGRAHWESGRRPYWEAVICQHVVIDAAGIAGAQGLERGRNGIDLLRISIGQLTPDQLVEPLRRSKMALTQLCLRLQMPEIEMAVVLHDENCGHPRRLREGFP